MEMNFEEILKHDPGHPCFVDYAESMRAAGNLDRSQEICLRGLSANPGAHLGRLLLARLYYEKGYYPFCAEQIRLLAGECPEVQSLGRLLRALSPDLKSQQLKPEAGASEETIAETELEVDLIDEIERSPK